MASSKLDKVVTEAYGPKKKNIPVTKQNKEDVGISLYFSSLMNYSNSSLMSNSFNSRIEGNKS